MKSSVLITGIGGFLGGFIAREFSSKGWKVYGIDTLAPENAYLPEGVTYKNIQLPCIELESDLNKWNPVACIHCAGRASVPESFKTPAADFDSSVVLTSWLVSLLRDQLPSCKLVYLSSAAVYGNPDELPITEMAQCKPISPYGYHKRISEMLVEQAAKLFKLPSCSARIFSAYGPGLRRQVVWEICQQAVVSGSISMQGTGAESRDFIHAADVAAAIYLIVRHADFLGESYNVASGAEVKVSDIATLVSEMLPKKITPQWQSRQRQGDPERWIADISKISAFGFKPKYDLHEGLASVLRWAQTM